MDEVAACPGCGVEGIEVHFERYADRIETSYGCYNEECDELENDEWVSVFVFSHKEKIDGGQYV